MSLIAELTALSAREGHCSEEGLREIAERLHVPLHRLEGLVSFYPQFQRTSPPDTEVHLCRDLPCFMAAGDTRARLQEELGSSKSVEVKPVSCIGRCDAAPAVAINGVPMSASDVQNVTAVARGLAPLPGNEPTATPRRWLCDPYPKGTEPYQMIQSLSAGGESARDSIIATLEEVGHRGMGGAGFPTGLKWKLVRGEEASPKYIIVNADESEPGTFKDRVILEELPHLVVEGALISGFVIGATRGTIYIRHEYGRERTALLAELERARELGVLGAPQGFDLDVFVSPGGYIQGEESALLEALEDRRGEPRERPPYPGTRGLWGQPTLVNNVETLALVPAILSGGPDRWRGHGTRGCEGLKFISVSGDVQLPGVFEIGMGTTVRELIEMAGGMKDGRPLRAFAPGGSSSNFLTADRVDTPLDFDTVQQAGSMLGSGAVVVVAEGRDMVEIGVNVARFFRNESCGKCVPCRTGSDKAVQMMDAVLSGRGSWEMIDAIEPLAATMRETSICGLGQVALSPLLSVLRGFPEDLEQHLGPRDA